MGSRLGTTHNTRSISARAITEVSPDPRNCRWLQRQVAIHATESFNLRHARVCMVRTHAGVVVGGNYSYREVRVGLGFN
jgi:hypothetical protein